VDSSLMDWPHTIPPKSALRVPATGGRVSRVNNLVMEVFSSEPLMKLLDPGQDTTPGPFGRVGR